MTATTEASGNFDLDTPVRTRRLTFLDEGDEVTVGRPDIDSYVHLPSDGAALLQRIVDGDTPNQAAEWYAQTYGETVDMGDFLETLQELEFLADPDEVIDEHDKPIKNQWLAKALFSPIAWIIYGALFVGAVTASVLKPELLPHYTNSFWTESLLVVVMTMFIGQIPFLLIHEWYHAMAGRRIGLNSTLSVGRRMYFIVFQTSMDGLVSVPRKKRYLPILAGPLADIVIASTLTIMAFAFDNAFGRACLALALASIFRFLWQCYFFLRNDGYYLVTTVLGCKDLHATSLNLNKRRFAKMFGKTPPALIEASPADHKAARWYSWLIIVGYSLMIVSLAFFAIPSVIYILVEAYTRIVENAPIGMIIDSTITATLVCGQFIVAYAISIRDKRRQKKLTTATMKEAQS